MIKLMIVAGEQTNELARHLGSSGVFKVDFAYKNLYEYEEEIRNSIITVDKFLYVYQSAQMKSRLDMSILQNLKYLIIFSLKTTPTQTINTP